MEAEGKTVAYYLEQAQSMEEEEFTTTFNHPVLIEKLGVFPHEALSLLSGTVIVQNNFDVTKLAAEAVEQDILTAKVFPLRKRPGSMGTDIFVGRAPTNDIILASRSVSKSHAQFTPIPDTGTYEIADMFSSNGTFLNDQKIHPFEKHQVNDRDKIRFGPDYLLIYCSPRAFYEVLKSLGV